MNARTWHLRRFVTYARTAQLYAGSGATALAWERLTQAAWHWQARRMGLPKGGPPREPALCRRPCALCGTGEAAVAEGSEHERGRD